ncbi:MAG: UPF0755 protein, partial [Bradymonadia bacterium]
ERMNVVTEPETTVTIAPGTGPIALVQQLLAEGVIQPDVRWSVWLRISPVENCLQAGTHRLPASATPAALLFAFCEPTEAPQFDVTVRPGSTVFSLAEQFAERGLAEDAGAALLLLQDPAFAALSGVRSQTVEGYLWPETIRFELGAPLPEVVARFIEEGHDRRDAIWQANEDSRATLAARYGLDDEDFLTIASIVEREAVVDEERPIIARVIYNRLAAGMPLQMDPTCVYSAEHHNQRPTRELCRNPDNTYSTYVIRALPPTPIAMPSAASLEAALAPADDPGVLYFVTIGDGSGRHAFANTLNEHQANVDRWLSR